MCKYKYMGLKNICIKTFKHQYTTTVAVLQVIYVLEEFMDVSYANMYKFGFILRNGPTNVRKSGK